MASPATDQNTTTEGSSRENLRVLQARKRETPASQNPDATLMVQRIEHIIGQSARLTLRVRRIDSQRPSGRNEFC